MTEIQRLLTATIDDLNLREKRDNRPRFSISFIRKHPGLFVAMYAAWLAVVLFVVFNAFFFFDVNPRYRYEDIDVLDFRVCYNGEWYNTRFVPTELIDSIMHSPAVETAQKEKLQKMVSTKGQLSFYDVFTLSRPAAA